MAKPTDAVASRQMVALRPSPDLRVKLEAAAEEAGRPISKEAEWRLAESFQKARDPLQGIFSDEVRAALCGSPPFAHLVEAIADVLLNSIRAANSRGRDEIEVRTAARAALNLAADRFLWRGEKNETPVEPPRAPAGARTLDYPPAHLGYEIASQRLMWLSNWHEDDAANDTAEERIRNLYSGDGRTVLVGPSAEDEEARRVQARADAKAALARGDVEHEAPERVLLYKPTRSAPLMAEDGAAPPPRSLKDIMGR